jgi:hypothetical protein
MSNARPLPRSALPLNHSADSQVAKSSRRRSVGIFITCAHRSCHLVYAPSQFWASAPTGSDTGMRGFALMLATLRRVVPIW